MIKKIAFVAVAAAALLICLPVSAKPKRDKKAEKFEKEVAAIVKDQEIVGANVIVLRDNDIVLSKSYGVSNLKKGTEMTTSHIFRLGAIVRPFAVVATMQLVEQGKISLTADISDYLGFKVRNPRYPDLPITIKMLLTNTSTIGEPKEFLSIEYMNPDKNPDAANIFRPTGKPGVAYFATGRNALILAAIVEKVTGQRYDEYLKANVFEPLELEGACFDPVDIDRSLLTTGYSWSQEKNDYLVNSGNIYKKHDWSDYELGEDTFKLAGTPGLGMSTNDLARFVATIMNGGVCPFNQARILSAASVQEILRLQVHKKRSGMFFGTNSTDVEGYTVYLSTGVTYGLSTMFAFNLEDNIAVIASCTGGKNPEAPKGRNTYNRDVRKAFVTVYAN